ncbi:unnamed protein product [Durusdinium trenchii]|uniref:Uncharacterized protein n=1 Tax=Durusdinium trenchii TaxID=1381693 RepID=A0ABP0MHT0_9DINO
MVPTRRPKTVNIKVSWAHRLRHEAVAEKELGSDERCQVVTHASSELPVPQLDFDAKVTEYSVCPTKLQRGALWMDGRSSPLFDMAWTSQDLLMMKAPVARREEGLSRESICSSIVVPQVYVAEDLQEEIKAIEAAMISEASRAPSGISSRTTVPAPLPVRRGAPPRPTDPPILMEVPHCWHAASYTSKWQLVHHASESPGEVSSIINEVCRRPRGKSALRPRLGQRVGTPR